jgi:hypothetical protein
VLDVLEEASPNKQADYIVQLTLMTVRIKTVYIPTLSHASTTASWQIITNIAEDNRSLRKTTAHKLLTKTKRSW